MIGASALDTGGLFPYDGGERDCLVEQRRLIPISFAISLRTAYRADILISMAHVEFSGGLEW